MLTKLSKIMVVFIATCSIAFMGFAIALSNSGPNWRVETRNLPDYTFALSTGENPQWTATRRDEQAAAGTSANLADVIGRAYDAERSRNEAVINGDGSTPSLQLQIDGVEEAIGFRTANIVADTNGMAARVAQLAEERDTLQQQVKDVILAANAKGEQAKTIREEAERRRGSVFRLRRQMESIETESHQLVVQRRLLLDLWYQMEGLRLRLAEREQQLVSEGATVPTAAAQSPASPQDQNVSFEQDSEQ